MSRAAAAVLLRGGPPSLGTSFRPSLGFASLRGLRPCGSLRGRFAALLGVLLLAAPPAWASEGSLVLVPDPRILVLLLLLFMLLVPPVNALLLRPVFRVLDDREDRIAGTRQRADKVSADADEILARYEQAVRDVRDEAERDRKQRLLAARSETATQTAAARAAADQDSDRARREIAEALANARQSLRPHAELLAREAAARVIGRSLS